ncbi:MAG: hypothetical protein JWM68_3614 [Verrucomicrobiales bacterium]|nr:hypothetical protein [Verrucomicrobiales bacterium]
MARSLLILSLAAIPSLAVADTTSSLPWVENFPSTNLSSNWAEEVSPGGKIFIKDGWITFESALPDRSHIQRSGDIDNITVSAKVVRWSGIYLVWDEANWCGLGKLSPTPFGRIYTMDVCNGKTNEVDHRGVDFNLPHTLRVQLGSDHVRFQYLFEKQWLELRTMERPKGFVGAPKFIRVGKYYGSEDKPYGAQKSSEKASGAVRELRVEVTPIAELNLSAAELKAVRNPPPERVNALLTQNEEDPTFEKIAPLYPPMRNPREIVGVPAHPLDIGIDRLGRLDVSPWTPAPLAWFEVGNPGKSFGQEGVPFTRRLLHGYLPVLALRRVIEGNDCQMNVFGWSEGCRADKDLYAYVSFAAHPLTNTALPENFSMLWANNGKHTFPLKPTNGAAQCFFRFKFPEPGTVTEISAEEFTTKQNEVVSFWKKHLEPANIFNVPDTRVMEAYRAWIVYSMLNADTINGFVEPHDGSGFYEEMFGNSVSVQSAAMDMYGFHDYAARMFQTQIHFQQPDGLYTQVCGLTDPGGFLFGLARHYEMTRDKEWLRKVSPNIIKQCEWLMSQRGNTLKEGMLRGLIKFRPYNDYPDPVYNYLGNAWCAYGMKQAANALQEIGISDARKFADEADKYRQDILASMEASAFDDHGQTLLPMEPDTHRLLKLSKNRGGDYYGLIASPLLGMGFLPTNDKRTTWLVDILEKRGGLIGGVCEFQCGIDHAYTYGYLMNALKRDEPRKTLLGFWSFLAFGMTRDTYSPVEVTMIETGENHYTLPHLYSCTEQLRLLRNMLLHEDGNVLWIAKGAPRAWFQAGKNIAITAAPTEFGPVSYEIKSMTDGTTRISIDPPLRRTPEKICVRLRDPQHRRIIAVNNSYDAKISFSDDTVTINDLKTPADLQVYFSAATSTNRTKNEND